MGLFGKKKNGKKKEAPIDYASLFMSMDKGQQLFNQLKVRCHPDRFAGTNRYESAEEIFKQVQANSTDYDALMALKDRIDKEL